MTTAVMTAMATGIVTLTAVMVTAVTTTATATAVAATATATEKKQQSTKTCSRKSGNGGQCSPASIILAS
jgi:hypothetical protein